MTTELHDLKDFSVVSNCCGAAVYTDLGICVDCLEHCGIEEVDEIIGVGDEKEIV